MTDTTVSQRQPLLSVSDVKVQFRVRGRILTAIRGISLDIYKGESIAIVGESGSGKSVFTKTFSGMNDSNGFIPQGHILFNDEELKDIRFPNDAACKNHIKGIIGKLDEYAHFELGADIHKELVALEEDMKAKATLTPEEKHAFDQELEDLQYRRTECFNESTMLNKKTQKTELAEAKAKLKDFDAQIKACEKKAADLGKERAQAVKNDTALQAEYSKKRAELEAAYKTACAGELSEEIKARNVILAKEVQLSVGRYPSRLRRRTVTALLKRFKAAQTEGADISDDAVLAEIYARTTPRVRYLSEDDTELKGECILDLAYVNSPEDWAKIRGKRIATVFQDPMTSLNPIITIGKQISSIIIKHQGCSEAEARRQALDMMDKVGIPNPEARYDDYPFQYSGGMRQRIVIAIALSCRPEILICDEPTTALDVTIQAQILNLIKSLQKELGFTIVFITHDLGVVANIADRVAVMYGGQIVEVGTVEDVFYDPRHPYTWALLSALPQIAERKGELFCITGTPPSLYHDIVGDAFAPRNAYAMKIDSLLEPPMFKVSETHSAKTWLLHPDAPKVEKPEAIHDMHGRLRRAFNI